MSRGLGVYQVLGSSIRAGTIVILTSYMDESGTHDGSAKTAMAAIMATASQWTRFQSDIEKLKREYRFKVFHTKKFKAKAGEFRGWGDEKCSDLLRDLTYIISQRLMHGTEFGTTKVRLDSCYGFCFRVCLTDQITELFRRLSSHKKFGDTRLHVVMEGGHRNAGDVERIYQELKRHLKNGSELLASITFSTKEECAPLMIADFLAHSAYMRKNEDALVIIPPGSPLPREKIGLIHLECTHESIDAIKE